MSETMTKDIIYREDAIDALYQYPNINWTTLDVLKMINDLPSAQPKPCKDAVSKSEVLETYADLYDVFDDNKEIQNKLHKVFDRINELPSVMPKEQRWIPCSERLPEDEYVLISKKPTKILGYKWSVDIAIRTADQRSGKIQWRDSGFGVIQDDKVLAWMPRPKPYREEGEAE